MTVTRRDAIVLAAGGVLGASCDRKKRSDPVSDTPTILAREPLAAFPWQTRDPFLFCVYHKDDYPAGNERLGPVASLAGRTIGNDFAGIDGWRMYHGDVVPGFPRHPHRGFETVTVVRRGYVDHSDSLGATARYGDGDVQWLTTGGGIQHAEMFPLVRTDADNPLELFQIWLNLPAKSKMVPAYFTMMWGETIPTATTTADGGATARITAVAGTLPGAGAPPSPPPDSWASQADADVAIYTVAMEPGASCTLPAAAAGSNRDLYAFAGDGLTINGEAAGASTRASVRPDTALRLVAGAQPIEILVLQGRPIGEPVVQHGPFVMNSKDEIVTAIRDYQRTQFGGWPWQGADPVHAARETRFAIHPDGREDRPTKG